MILKKNKIALDDFCAVLIKEETFGMIDSEKVIHLLLFGLGFLDISLNLVARIFEPFCHVSFRSDVFIKPRIFLLLCYEVLQLGFFIDLLLSFLSTGLIIWHLFFFLRYVNLARDFWILLGLTILLLLKLLYPLLLLFIFFLLLLLLQYVLWSFAGELSHEFLVRIHVDQAVEARLFTITKHSLVHSPLLCLLLGLVDLLLLPFISAPLPRLLRTHLLPHKNSIKYSYN